MGPNSRLMSNDKCCFWERFKRFNEVVWRIAAVDQQLFQDTNNNLYVLPYLFGIFAPGAPISQYISSSLPRSLARQGQLKTANPNEAQKEIVIGSYYWSLLVKDTGDNYTVDTTNTAGDGQLIYDTLLKTALRGVNVKIAQTYKPEGVPETSDLAAKSNGRIKVRSLDFTQWYPGGILHTKSWAVDGKHLYVGSANFDWRALTQ
ncbi:phospholipase D domain protein, partial [Ancylostoma duodenale]